MLALLCPYLYSLVLGCVWGGLFDKKFSGSLAVAFMAHIIIVMISGIVFRRLYIGIYGGVILAIILGVFLIFNNKNNISKVTVMRYISANWSEGIFIFTLFYVICYILNIGKRFTSWDEFSHWGMFLKESLRLDSLYCMSSLSFAHKDYVPAVTLFETIWCRLCGSATEPDAYRAIQNFMFSMLMPMFEGISEYVNDIIKKQSKRIDCLKYRFFQLSTVLLTLLVPLVFDRSDGFSFYRSIYCDISVGIIFFWCVFEAYKDYKDISYQFLELIIGCTVLVLSKMTAIALMPLVIGLYVVKLIIFSREEMNLKKSIRTLVLVTVPVALWYWFNRFVDKYVENKGGIQSYDGMKISSVIDVFLYPEKSKSTYLKSVKEAYIGAITDRNILVHGSYVTVVTAVVIAFFLIAHYCGENNKKRKSALAGLWTMISGVFYAFLMCFLYCTQFTEYEAMRLAGYARYMNSFVISLVFFLLAVYYDSGIWKARVKAFWMIFIIVFVDLAIFNIRAFGQFLPGTITRDNDKVSDYTTCAEVIINRTKEDDKIFVIKRGDNGDFIWHERYYCSPRTVNGGSIGPAVNDEDIFSSDKTLEEFVESVKGHDYIYFCGLDDAFCDKYAVAFSNPDLLVEGAIYKISNIDSKIHMQD